MKKFDEIDEKIISILTEDARISNREVARIIGLSDTGIRKRLKRLNSIGAAKVATVVNPAAAGLNISALVRLQTSPDVARKVVEQAATIEAVSFLALTAGRFNIVALLLAEDQSGLEEIVHSQFRCWDGIHRISVVQLNSTAKHRLDLIYIQ